MHCIITVKQPNQLLNGDEIKKRYFNLQTVKAKENNQVSHGGPSLRQTCADPPI